MPCPGDGSSAKNTNSSVSVSAVPSKPQFSNVVSEMKGEALQATASINALQDVWSHVDHKLENYCNRLNHIDQYMRKDALLVRGLKDIPKKTYGIDFSMYVLGKLRELLPSIAGKIHLNDISISHPLPTKKNAKTCVIIKFVRRDIKNLIFFAKRELKNSPDKISITEHLTNVNLWYMDEAKKMVGFKNVWSSQCVVYALVNGNKVAIRSEKDLNIVYNLVRVRKPPPRSHEHDLPPHEQQNRDRASVIKAVGGITTTTTNENPTTSNNSEDDTMVPTQNPAINTS